MTHKLQKLIDSDKPVLIAFLHAAHQNAVDVKYILQQLKEKYGDKAEFIKIDGSYDHQLERHFKIDSYPTWILYKNNQELWRDSGTKKPEVIDESINGLI